ncbi:NDP-hexose 2,3-dehydratase family protein [Actinokineospora globicatena]|uniref:NDP-hexose 2,3-dehydratase n=1 Tax=Actinokineospora globicatena TaxID=103729 RepID=A0A9W6V5Z1_9PSEU|nr:NDP-hexose 2,3-dehydratase family protein [Actinokineospora globicatena]GLW89882.1 NDP-hexose 2,3-dehydratase [Actinokineospora globicatena]
MYTSSRSVSLVSGVDLVTPRRFAGSAACRASAVADPNDVREWFDNARNTNRTTVAFASLDDLPGWHTDPRTGVIGHDTGKFFSVEGLRVRLPGAPVESWHQPIINQPEIGILGFLVKEFDGVPHLLMQAKTEPGNLGGAQLAPTVQATRSNYTRVHGGRAIPYLDYFQRTGPHRVLADVRQSEQGSWFRHKRNRNMIVEVTGDVPVLPGFRWFTLGQLHERFAVDDAVNMDARTVLSCMPFTGDEPVPADGDDFRSALAHSCDERRGGLHATRGVLNWITDARVRADLAVEPVALDGLPGWVRRAGRIRHEDGLFFDVVGVHVRSGEREVRQWSQPMIKPHGTGVIAFLVTRIDGVLHALAHARVEPGFVDSVELAPTVQCAPSTYDGLQHVPRPAFLDDVLTAHPDRVRFDTTMSEEGGRFHDARNRYLVVEVEPRLEPPDFRWLTVWQLADLIRHSHYVNIQARGLVACLHSLLSTETRSDGGA